jgi:hypothetical protein
MCLQEIMITALISFVFGLLLAAWIIFKSDR